MKKEVAESALQPKSFEFTPENQKKSYEITLKYPFDKKSAILPLLHLVSEQNQNWIPKAAIEKIAKILETPFIKVYEVLSSYSMFNTSPVGKNLIQVCRTTPCWLRGCDKICKKIKELLQIDINQTTKDKKFTLIEVECLGACIDAPVVQINNKYYENLDEEKIAGVIQKLKDQ